MARAGSPTNHLLPEHAQLLADLGVSAELVEARGYSSEIKADELARRGFRRNQCRTPALVIPIRSIDGRVKAYQIRPDCPRESEGTPIRYELVPECRGKIDVPRGVPPALQDGTRRMLITTSVIGADALVSRGECAVALVGAWANCVGDRLWDQLPVAGRTIGIILDSDEFIESAHRAAIKRFVRGLNQRGADARVLLVPPGLTAENVTLEEFLAGGGDVDEMLSHGMHDLPSSH